jgi:hypothetical protein
LSSTTRVCPWVTLEIVPQVVLSQRVAQYVVSKIGHLKGGKIKRKGHTFNADEDSEEKRRWKLRIFLAHRNDDIIAERKGDVLLVSMDESYIHEQHHADSSLLETDEHGYLINAMNCATRDGNRLIMIGAMSTFGYIVTHDKDGEVVRDCVWVNSKGDRVQHYGRFKELNNKGEFRLKEEKKGKNKKLNKNNTVPQLKEAMIKADLNCYGPSGKLLTKKQMTESLYPSNLDPNNEVAIDENVIPNPNPVQSEGGVNIVVNDLQLGMYIDIYVYID